MSYRSQTFFLLILVTFVVAGAMYRPHIHTYPAEFIGALFARCTTSDENHFEDKLHTHVIAATVFLDDSIAFRAFFRIDVDPICRF